MSEAVEASAEATGNVDKVAALAAARQGLLALQHDAAFLESGAIPLADDDEDEQEDSNGDDHDDDDDDDDDVGSSDGGDSRQG